MSVVWWCNSCRVWRPTQASERLCDGRPRVDAGALPLERVEGFERVGEPVSGDHDLCGDDRRVLPVVAIALDPFVATHRREDRCVLAEGQRHPSPPGRRACRGRGSRTRGRTTPRAPVSCGAADRRPRGDRPASDPSDGSRKGGRRPPPRRRRTHRRRTDPWADGTGGMRRRPPNSTAGDRSGAERVLLIFQCFCCSRTCVCVRCGGELLDPHHRCVASLADVERVVGWWCDRDRSGRAHGCRCGGGGRAVGQGDPPADGQAGRVRGAGRRLPGPPAAGRVARGLVGPAERHVASVTRSGPSTPPAG